MLYSYRKKGPGHISKPQKQTESGIKLADRANSGTCTLRGPNTLYGAELAMRFYNKRYLKEKFKIKVM